MKRLLLLLLIAPMFGYGQGEQRYADGTTADQDGNTFEWINYGTQDWAIENAEVVTYRDGTTIPQVKDANEWQNLTTGAWCYYDNDPTKAILYNWFAVAGIHDAASYSDATLRKVFAPDGWHVPSHVEWETLENYLIERDYNNYDYPAGTIGNKIGKAMASTTGWSNSGDAGNVGNTQSTNNTSGFNALPTGIRFNYGSFDYEGDTASFFSSTEYDFDSAWRTYLYYGSSYLYLYPYHDTPYLNKQHGFSVRFVRDTSTASTMDYSNTITIYPNPTTSILTIEGNKEYYVEIYDMAGNKVMALTGNNINMAHLSTATYIVKATDKSNNEELTYKVVKN